MLIGVKNKSVGRVSRSELQCYLIFTTGSVSDVMVIGVGDSSEILDEARRKKALGLVDHKSGIS